ncbi:MAG: DUF1697 domain-containing protein [Gemmatimonadaceae bacterium]|nr:DUF1697 domain-containing protein [Gemmatimonadaceae bacterium]
MRWLALLRGINVGGNNIIPMADLRACIEELGYEDVATYIQSGNVLFDGPATHAKVVAKVEKALKKNFDYEAKLVLLSADQLAEVIAEAPRGFGSKPDEYRYDVMFLRPTVNAEELVKDFPVNPEVDACWAGSHAVYYRRLIAKADQTYLDRAIRLPAGREMTVRNWNTTSRLAAMAATEAPKKRVTRKS